MFEEILKKLVLAERKFQNINIDYIENRSSGWISNIFSIRNRMADSRSTTNYTAGDHVVGDKFDKITKSTIINRALVENSFNKVQQEYGDESTNVLKRIAEFIQESDDLAAGVLFDKFNEELNKPQPESSILEQIWKGLEKVLPSITRIESQTPSRHFLPYNLVYNLDENSVEADKPMGDIFENIHNATIINKALVENSFNKVKTEQDEETGKALVKAAEFIEKSKDPAAGTLFNNFTEELNKPQPDKSRLKSFWSGIQNALPSIASISESVAKIVSLFT